METAVVVALRRGSDAVLGCALKWLKHFTEKGLLVKEGAINAPIYFLAKDNKGNEDNGISLHTKRLEP